MTFRKFALAAALGLSVAATQASANITTSIEETFASGAVFTGTLTFADGYAGLFDVSGVLAGGGYGTIPFSWAWWVGTGYSYPINDTGVSGVYNDWLMDGTPSSWAHYIGNHLGISRDRAEHRSFADRPVSITQASTEPMRLSAPGSARFPSGQSVLGRSCPSWVGMELPQEDLTERNRGCQNRECQVLLPTIQALRRPPLAGSLVEPATSPPSLKVAAQEPLASPSPARRLMRFIINYSFCDNLSPSG